MPIKTATVTGTNISPHIKDTEWQCHDGTKTILYSTNILSMIEKLRDYVGGTITINSGYRTAKYNKRIGGATSSQHVKGTAADIVVKDKTGKVIPAKLVCCLCQTLGFKGIGYISATATHVDMRSSGTYKGDERSGYSGNVGNDFYAYFGVNINQITALKATSATTTMATASTKNEEKDDMEYYKTIDNVPASYKEAVKELVDAKFIVGDGKGNINISEAECKVYTVLHRKGII